MHPSKSRDRNNVFINCENVFDERVERKTREKNMLSGYFFIIFYLTCKETMYIVWITFVCDKQYSIFNNVNSQKDCSHKETVTVTKIK